MIHKSLILFMMLTILAIYDKGVSMVTEYNVNLDILYFGGWHLFAILVSITFASYRRIWIEKLIFYLLSFVFAFNLLQNISVLNHDYFAFKSFVNNAFIDQLKWFFFIASLITLLWISIRYRRV